MTPNVPYVLVLSTHTNVCESAFGAQSVWNEPYLQRYDGAHEQTGGVELFLNIETKVPLPHEIVQLLMSLFNESVTSQIDRN